MSTLTERYVHEVVRRIPADQRDDVADELHATIADTIDSRDAADHDAAEREVLTEMGDPIRLASRYADRPLALIGPELFPAYLRLLTLLLSTVLPLVVVATVAVDVLDHHDLGSAAVAGIGAVVTVGAQIIAWLTVVFAVVERYPRGKAVRAVAKAWTPDALSELRQPAGSATTYISAAWHSLLIGLVVWQQVTRPYRADDGSHLTVLDPALWSGWIWPILAGLAGLAVLDVVRATRPWTFPLATAYAVAQAMFALPLALVVYRQELFNPAFVADVTVYDEFYTVATLGILVVSATKVLRRVREARS